MNRTVLCLALAAMPFLSFAQKDCRVEGKANPEQVGRYVYIVYGNQITDSVKVNKNAEFSFALKADDKLYTCAEYGGRDVLAFVSEKGKVELNLRDMSCKGGELNKEVSLFNSASKEAWKGYEKRAAEIKAKAVSEAEKEKEQDALYEETIKSLQKTAEEAMSRISDKEAAGWMLASLSYYYSLENFFKQYDKLSGEAKNYPGLQTAYKAFEALRNTSEGKMFTDFVIENGGLKDERVKFSDYVGKGKYTLVDFWATWCGPCKREIPNVRNIYKEFGDRITVLSVAVWDKRASTEAFIEKNDMPWEHIIDAQQIPTDIYGIQGIPQIMLFAPDGTIVKRDLRGEEIRKLLESILEK